MTKTLYAKKLGMTEAYVDNTRCGVTVLEVLPLHVIAHQKPSASGVIKTQVAIGTATKKLNKAQAGQLKKANLTPRYIREFVGLESLEVGTAVDISDLTTAGTTIDIMGVSKGKGLAGVVKRHHFAGGPRTHGQSDRLRRAGSIGQGTTPGRVYKGKKMSGRMGNDTVTVKNSIVVAYDGNNHKLYVAGPVPGHTGTLVRLTHVSNPVKVFPAVSLPKAPVQTATTTESEAV